VTERPIRVLLVDDQTLIRRAIGVVVAAQPDMTVVGEAENGEVGLQQVDALEPDVVLLDLRMPVLDGVGMTERLFARPRSRPRVIVLTTFELDAAAAMAIRLGASGFLLKDTTPEFLLASIRSVHGGGTVLAPDDLLSLFAHGGAAQPPPAPDEFLRLTERELAVFGLLVRGASNAEIADVMFVSESTVKTHVSGILTKLAVRDRVQLLVYAHDHGLTRPGGK
jgi:DNA-binding NarL/FixJ family response regulator